MPDPSDVHGLSRPLGSENFTRAAYRTLIEQIDAAIRGISPMTTAQRDALAGAQLWPERVIYNTTAARFERWTGTAWTEDVWASYALRADALHRTLVTAKGDLIVGSGSGAVVRRPIGNAGQFFTADPAHISGTSWVDHGGAGDPHPQYVLESREGVPNGVGTLGAGGTQPVAQLAEHGADKHVNRTRSVAFLPDMIGVVNGAERGTWENDALRYVRLLNAANTRGLFGFAAPLDFIMASAVTIRMWIGTGGSGSVRLRVGAAVEPPLNTATTWTETEWTEATQLGVKRELTRPITLGAAASPGDWVAFYIERRGNHPEDGSGDDLYVFMVQIEYSADS